MVVKALLSVRRREHHRVVEVDPQTWQPLEEQGIHRLYRAPCRWIPLTDLLHRLQEQSSRLERLPAGLGSGALESPEEPNRIFDAREVGVRDPP